MSDAELGILHTSSQLVQFLFYGKETDSEKLGNLSKTALQPWAS